MLVNDRLIRAGFEAMAFGSFPLATDFPFRFIWDTTSSQLYVSDGTNWVTASSLANAVDNITTFINGGLIAVRQGDRSHVWKVNGLYGSITIPADEIDEVFIAPYDIKINSLWIKHGAIGASGTTEYDLLIGSSGGSFSSILTTTGKITSAASPGVWTDSGSVIGIQTGVTKPVLASVNVNAGQGLRFDMLQKMTGNPSDATMEIWYQQR